ncbi:MAG: phosphatase PAP2 family protein [Pseudomonadota bacterium]
MSGSAYPLAGGPQTGADLPPASGVLFYLLLLLGTALIFAAWPNLDLAASRFAQEVAGGEGFAPRDGSWWLLYAGMKPAFFVLMGAIGVLGFVSWVLGRPFLAITPRRALFAIAAMALIQGLVIDVYLKDGFGRARPREIEAFGGALTYTPYYLVSEACSSNCSFVSGHAGMAYSTFVLCFMATTQVWRRRLFWAALAFGLLTGWMRVIQGAHFLSDVLFSGLVVWGLTWLLALAFLRPWGQPLDRLLPDFRA